MSRLDWELIVGDKLTRCAVSRGGRLDDIESEVYLDKLADLDAELVSRVLDAMALEPREAYEPVVPPVPTIRARCEQLARQDAADAAARRLLPLPVTSDDRDSRTLYFCPECRDESSGWREMFCTGAAAGKDVDRRPIDPRTPIYYCGRKFQHTPHPYVEKCACADTNPVIARRREAQTRYSAAKS